mmetsp:Transcript_40105/g.96833  ORF Transcript_40105/g.96833 Transcript_40105/m.96833 type:complete len:314 (-) Transcript_40105:558-1499(-)
MRIFPTHGIGRCGGGVCGGLHFSSDVVFIFRLHFLLTVLQVWSQTTVKTECCLTRFTKDILSTVVSTTTFVGKEILGRENDSAIAIQARTPANGRSIALHKGSELVLIKLGHKVWVNCLDERPVHEAGTILCGTRGGHASLGRLTEHLLDKATPTVLAKSVTTCHGQQVVSSWEVVHTNWAKCSRIRGRISWKLAVSGRFYKNVTVSHGCGQGNQSPWPTKREPFWLGRHLSAVRSCGMVVHMLLRTEFLPQPGILTPAAKLSFIVLKLHTIPIPFLSSTQKSGRCFAQAQSFGHHFNVLFQTLLQQPGGNSE